MKKFFIFIISVISSLSLVSCVTTAEAQTDAVYASNDALDVDVIITYGTPFYNSNGLLLYYFYRDLYYYPFYSSNHWYFRPYNRPVHHYRPVPRDFYKHRPNVYNRRHYHSIPNIRHRYNNSIHRSHTNMRSSTRHSIGGNIHIGNNRGHVGSRR